MNDNDFWVGQHVLVIGAKGFKGAYLCYMLAKLGARVHGIVSERDDPRSAYNLLDLKPVIDEVHVTSRNQRGWRMLSTKSDPRLSSIWPPRPKCRRLRRTHGMGSR